MLIFHKILITFIFPLDMTFVVLDDITNGMKKPCVMDVKIGLQTWEPGCSEKKKKDENVIKLLNLYLTRNNKNSVLFNYSYSN